MNDLTDRLAAVDPDRLVQLLEQAGFTKVGGRTDVYTRMGWPGVSSRDHTLVVPLDRTMADYPDLLAEVLAILESAAGRGERARSVLDGLFEDQVATIVAGAEARRNPDPKPDDPDRLQARVEALRGSQ